MLSFDFLLTKRARCCAALLAAASVLSGMHRADAAALPPATALLTQGLQSFKPYGKDIGQVRIDEVAVTGQPFAAALRVDIPGRPAGSAQHGLVAHLNAPLKKGDVLWLSFKARRLDSKRETGEAFVEVRMERLVDGKYTWPSHLDRGISIGAEWSDTSIPFVLEQDVAPADTRIVIALDNYQQRFEMGPVTLLNYGPGVPLAALPRSTVHYAGDAPDAAWRKQAAERIERYRKGDLAIEVVGKDGKALAGAEVTLTMKRSAFHWGTAANSATINDKTSPDAKKYRETLAAYFNQVVYENEIKPKNWAAKRGAGAIEANLWLRQHDIGVRGHVMVWPSFRNSPQLKLYQQQPDALRRAILDGINEQSAVMRGQFDEWDVMNEPYAHHEFMDILGDAVMVDWFKAARAAAPGVKLFFNEYTMLHGEGKGSASQQFYDTVARLQAAGAPVDAIGEQAHIGGTPPGIEFVLGRLDHFATLGLPIQISEFDINSNDDDFKARYLADFMTAIYSHPSTVGFVQWGFWEGQHWFPVAALWNRDWTLRKHGQVYVDLVSKAWRTDFSGTTGADGVSRVRAVCGDYDVEVRQGGRSVRAKVSLDNKGRTLRIAL